LGERATEKGNRFQKQLAIQQGRLSRQGVTGYPAIAGHYLANELRLFLKMKKRHRIRSSCPFLLTFLGTQKSKMKKTLYLLFK